MPQITDRYDKLCTQQRRHMVTNAITFALFHGHTADLPAYVLFNHNHVIESILVMGFLVVQVCDG
jgi:hypothetical protein